MYSDIEREKSKDEAKIKAPLSSESLAARQNQTRKKLAEVSPFSSGYSEVSPFSSGYTDISPFSSARRNEETSPLQMKAKDAFRGPSSPFARTGGNPYAGTPLSVSGNLAESIQESFGIDTNELALRESPEVADMGARATAQGDVIRFAPGEFNPDTHEGLSVLGHELAHVREQADGGVRANIEGTNIHYDAGHEAASDLAGEAFASGGLVGGVGAVDLAGAGEVAVQGGWFGDLKDKVVNTAGNVWNGVTTTAGNVKDKVVNTAGNAWNNVTTTAGNVRDKVVSTAGNAWNNVTTTAGNVRDQVVNTAGNVWNGVTTTAGNVRDGIVKTVGNVSDTIKSKTNDVYQRLTAWHFEDRDKRNGTHPKWEEIEEDQAKDPKDQEWRRMDEKDSIYHDNGDEYKEIKFVHKDGREAVFNGKDYSIIEDPHLKATYNYVNPLDPKGISQQESWWQKAIYGTKVGASYAGHFFADVLPYWIGGNVRGDEGGPSFTEHLKNAATSVAGLSKDNAPKVGWEIVKRVLVQMGVPKCLTRHKDLFDDLVSNPDFVYNSFLFPNGDQDVAAEQFFKWFSENKEEVGAMFDGFSEEEKKETRKFIGDFSRSGVGWLFARNSMGLEKFGFEKDERGVIHARNDDCWQQKFGYNDYYDKAFNLGTQKKAAKFPFSYIDPNTEKKEEMIIWVWKGDYLNFGAGAELGVYKKDEQISEDIGTDHYQANKDYLNMEMELVLRYTGSNIFHKLGQALDKGTIATCTPKRQWWITAFNPKYQKVHPNDLSATFKVNFGAGIGTAEIYNNHAMYNAFYNAHNGRVGQDGTNGKDCSCECKDQTAVFTFL